MAIETVILKPSLRWSIAVNGRVLVFLPVFHTESEAERNYQQAHPQAVIITTDMAAHSCHQVQEAA